ncbi:MAG: hypothetical protein RJA70_4283 [Pseudomonadota bacterium]|jgi:serine/threonine protein kinase
MIGERINNVQIVSLLFEGGMGTVYEAEHVLMRRRFAVKVLRREFGADADLVQRFLDEARTTNDIRHPNIVEVVDAGVLPSGLPYFVMELLVGENLATRLARVGPLSIALALDITLQAAGAVHAAHQAGVVHRDLKPENLFLTVDSRVDGHEFVKVLDFGIAKLRGKLSAVRTNAGLVIGTPCYMAPEQCRGNQVDVDHRADVYAMGVILYEMLAGAPPFDAPSAIDLMMMQIGTLPLPISERRPDLPAPLAAVVMKALAKDPSDRFDNLAEMMAALGRRNTPAPWISPLEQPVSSTSPGLVPLQNLGELEQSRGQDARTTPPSADSAAELPREFEISHRRKRLALLLVPLGALAAGAAFLIGSIASETAPIAAPVIASSNVELLDAPKEVASIVTVSELQPAATAQLEPAATAQLEPQPAATVSVDELPRVPRRTWTPPRKAPKESATPTIPPESTTPELEKLPTVKAPQPPSEVGVRSVPGFLTIDSSPWSQVFLEGRLLGTTPLVKVALPPGRHVLTLKNPELASTTTYVVVIESDKALSRFVGWGDE